MNLRLRAPDRAAVEASVPVFVAPPKRRPRRRRWLAIGVLAGLLLILAASVLIGLRLQGLVTHVAAEAELGREELVEGGKILRAEGVSLSTPQVELAAGHFQRAEVHFQQAHAGLVHSRLVGLLGVLPVASDQVEAGRRLTDMGVHASRAGRVASQVVVDVLGGRSAPTPKSEDGPGQRILNLLATLDPQLESIARELDAIATDRSRLQPSGLVAPLSKAVTEFDAKFQPESARSMLASFRSDEQAIRQFLGAKGPRSYLVLQQDPAELRATGGFIGSIGYMNFDQGKMAPYQPLDVFDVDGRDGLGATLGPRGSPRHVDPPLPLETAFKLKSWELHDSNWSPDLPTAAAQAEFFLDHEIGKKVDGVITMDPYFISKLLSVIGPVAIPETGDVVTDSNFFATTLARIEVQYAVGAKKRFLVPAAKAIFARVLDTPPEKWFSLIQALKSGCDTRSLQAFIHDSEVESFINRHQCGGQVRPLKSDGLMIVETNVGGNKDDFWLQRSYRLGLAVRPDGSVRHTLRLHYHGLSAHGFMTGIGQRGYTGWLRVYVPQGAKLVSVQGTTLDAADELGRRVLQGWLYVQFDHEVDVTIVYDVDARALHSENHRLQLLWQKQSGRLADPISVELSLPPDWKLRANSPTGASPSPLSSNLSVDREFTFDY